MQFLHLALTCLSLAADGDKASTPPFAAAPNAKAIRLSETAAKLEARLAAPFNRERLKLTLEQVEGHLTKLKQADELEVSFGEQSLLRPELQAYLSWNLPMLNEAPTTKLHDFKDPKNQIHTIIEYGRALEAHGIDFVVVPIPTRLDLYPERLPGISREDAYRGGNRGMIRFMSELNRQGIELVDLYALFQSNLYADNEEDDEELYFQREYHWTQRAVRLASKAIATEISDRERFTPGTLREGVDFLIHREHAPWELVSSSGRETVELLFSTIETQAGERAFVRDRESDILLLGDSFMVLFRERNSDLASQLFAHLKRPLDQIAMSGGGAKRVWHSVARRGDQLAGKKIVVWEFTSRAITGAAIRPIEIFEN